jgi:hypothetical protein
MRLMQRWAWLPILALCVWTVRAKDPEPAARPKSAVILWVTDAPLTYDIRYAGGAGTTMPTALKYFLKDLAESEGWYLTGEDKSKTVASQSKRISLETTNAKSRLSAVRVSKVEVKEAPGAVNCVVTFGKKPSADELKRTEGILNTFARKYSKVAKATTSTVQHADVAKGFVWSFEVRFKEPPAKVKE